MEVVLVRSKEPRGVLMVFHGCMRRPTDWWHYESTCVTCIGKRMYTSVGTCTPGLAPVQKHSVSLARCSRIAMHRCFALHVCDKHGCISSIQINEAQLQIHLFCR